MTNPRESGQAHEVHAPTGAPASVLPATTLDHTAHDVLVIVTTLELDASHKRFRASKVERLR
jgi:hypothetical protein